jgi:hypothetical protein
MEILGEILIAVVQLLSELLLQLLAEALAEFGLEAIREAVRPSKTGRPLVAAIGYVLLGALFSFVSLWPFPHSFVHHAWLRLANLVIAPSIAGLAVVALGRWRISRGQAGLYLHRFSYGFLFALTFALIRFAFSR